MIYCFYFSTFMVLIGLVLWVLFLPVGLTCTWQGFSCVFYDYLFFLFRKTVFVSFFFVF